MKKSILSVLAFICLVSSVAAAEKLNVVTSSSTFAALGKEIAGDHADVTNVASPKYNAHFIEPKPSDVRKVRKADLFVFAGLDHEIWVDSLLEAAGKPELFRRGARNLELAEGIRLLEVPDHLDRGEGDIHAFGNPHYWLNPENLPQIAANFSAKLQEIDPANAAAYAANEKAFNAKLGPKIAEWRAVCGTCAGKEIISYHKDVEYLAEFLGLKIHEYVEPKPGIPPSPKHLAHLERDMTGHGVKLIVLASYYSREAADALAKKTGGLVRVIAQNVGEVPEAGDLWSYYDYNVRTIAEALK